MFPRTQDAVQKSFARVIDAYPKLKDALATAEFNCHGTFSIVGDDKQPWMELRVSVPGMSILTLLPEQLDLEMHQLCKEITDALRGIEKPFIRSMQETLVGCNPEEPAPAQEWFIDCFFAVHEMKGK